MKIKEINKIDDQKQKIDNVRDLVNHFRLNAILNLGEQNDENWTVLTRE